MALTRPRQFWIVLGAALGPMLAAFIEAGRSGPGTIMPWSAFSADLRAYLAAADTLMAGGDYYNLGPEFFPYIYPPIAAILAIPLALIPVWLAQVLWLLLQGCMVLAVLRRLGLQWATASAVASFTIMLAEPFSNTIELGQLGILLLLLVLLDVAAPRGRRRRLPGGVLIGLATGIKLTPAVFIIHLWLIGRRKDALVAVGTFFVTVIVGFVVSPVTTWGYWIGLIGGDSGANPDSSGWIANMSVVSATQRFLGLEAGTVVGLALAAVLVVLALAAARHAHRRGQPLLALGVLGVGSSLANPIAWVHHLTWVLLLLAALVPTLINVSDRVTGQDDPPAALPMWLKWVSAAVALWLLTTPQLKLKGAAGSQVEIHHYSVWQKVMAASPDILVAILAIVVLVWALAIRGPDHSARPVERGPEVT